MTLLFDSFLIVACATICVTMIRHLEARIRAQGVSNPRIVTWSIAIGIVFAVSIVVTHALLGMPANSPVSAERYFVGIFVLSFTPASILAGTVRYQILSR